MFDKPEKFDIPYYIVTLDIDIYPGTTPVVAAEQNMPEPGQYIYDVAAEFIEFTKRMFAKFDADNNGEYLIKDNRFTDSDDLESDYLLMYKVDPTGAVYAKYAYIIRLTTHRLPRTTERQTNKYKEEVAEHNQEWADENAAIPNKLPQQYKTIDIIANIECNYRGIIISERHIEYDNYQDVENLAVAQFKEMISTDDPDPDTFAYSNYMILKENDYFNVYNSKYERVNDYGTLSTLQEATDFIDDLNIEPLLNSTELTSVDALSDDMILEISDYVMSEVNQKLSKYGRHLMCLDAYVEDDTLFIMDVIDTENSTYTVGVRFSDLNSDTIAHQQHRLVTQITSAYSALYKYG